VLHTRITVPDCIAQSGQTRVVLQHGISLSADQKLDTSVTEAMLRMSLNQQTNKTKQNTRTMHAERQTLTGYILRY
jgi:hypothetical protein